MAGESSQIQLVVGVDQSASLSGFKDGINALIAEVNKNPPKIKVEVDTGSAKSIKSQIDSALKAASSGGTSAGTSLGTQFKNATTQAQKLVSTLNGINVNGLNGLTEALNGVKGADQLTNVLGRVSGEISEVAASVKVLESGERQLESVTITATDSFGNIVKQTAAWNEEEQKLVSTLDNVRAKVETTTQAQKNEAAAEKENLAVQKSYLTVLSSTDSFLKQYTAAQNSSTESSRNAYSTVESLRTELEGVHTSYETGATSADDFKMAVDKAALSVLENTVTVKQNGDAHQQTAATTTKVAAVEKSYMSTIASCDSFLERYTAAKNSANSASRAAYATVEQERAALKSTYKSYKSGTTSVEQLGAAVSNANVKIREGTVAVKENGDATKTLVGRVSDLAAKFSSWFSAYTIIIYITRAMKSLVSASVEIEDAMAQIQIVTGATDSQLTKFLSEATELAKELGQSITDVASSIETFSRLGYSFDEASELAEYATILANVADTDVDTATTGLTSIIKGYSLEASDAEHIADVLVTVGQEYAISAEELMEAFERGGAALAATGATVEQSAGLFAATNAALQDASTTGTMWKTNYCLCV